MTKSKFVKLLAIFALFALPQMALAAGGGAGTTDSFGVFANELGGWLTGNLGYIIAIVALIGSVVLYAFTHKGAVIIIGIIIAFLAGGSVGIAKFFFSQGGTAFSDTAAFSTP